MKEWIEVEDAFISNTPRGTDHEPTEYYVFAYECTRQKRGIRRKRCVQTLKGTDSDDLDAQLERLVKRSDVIYVGAVDRDYIRYRGEPQPKQLT